MPRVYIPSAIRLEVIERADGQCEFCLLHQDDAETPHQIDHLIAIKHGGRTIAENLALACQLCNRHKGSDLTAIDPEGSAIVPAFQSESAEVGGPLWTAGRTDRGAHTIRTGYGNPIAP
jgi:5-methylcytosine-specific restriction endonuclease McrA